MLNAHAEAERLANRPNLIKTSVDTTTEGQPVIFAQVLELEGCFGQGETRAAAIQDLRLAMADFIESLLQDGLPVPDPTKLTPTFGTATKGSYVFVSVDKKLQPKPVEASPDAYVFAPRVN